MGARPLKRAIQSVVEDALAEEILLKKVVPGDKVSAGFKKAIRIIDEYGLAYYHDSIVQITNYAVLLTDMGQPDVGLSALRKLCRVIREYNSDTGLDYASVQEAMGNISLTMGEISQATSYFQKAMEIYETVFEFEPDMIEAKKQELLGTYAQAGLYLGEKLLTKEGDI